MADAFVKLNCANCGAKLEVYDDMERFACRYCGTEMLVQRRGGTVGLKAITDAIKKVQAGTDKTAAELAITRLQKERQELCEENNGPVGCLAVVFFVLFCLSGRFAGERR